MWSQIRNQSLSLHPICLKKYAHRTQYYEQRTNVRIAATEIQPRMSAWKTPAAVLTSIMDLDTWHLRACSTYVDRYFLCPNFPAVALYRHFLYRHFPRWSDYWHIPYLQSPPKLSALSSLFFPYVQCPHMIILSTLSDVKWIWNPKSGQSSALMCILSRDSPVCTSRRRWNPKNIL